MWRISAIRWQLQKQVFVDAVGYSAAFAPVSERPVSVYQMATAVYSPAATQLRRRKGHHTRQKEYTAKMRLVSGASRLQLGMHDTD
ncbi:hypothetical protein DQ04_04131030 [Trypanosoma grayi]|uniref:hypothetical protein n=1 Tax=Trypanosoma grayi TaxID=71804 RepID=UPI0004F4B735|nr:hypothetical protein DQ04_04131030 [Trypanosoma grayi]KEG10135.1 hypothetical protein DQ04_04131030 [Trypanosoma grayi]